MSAVVRAAASAVLVSVAATAFAAPTGTGGSRPIELAFALYMEVNLELVSPIYAMRASGRFQRMSPQCPDCSAYPRWSPDGSALAYSGVRSGRNGTTQFGIFLVSADGAHRRRVCGSSCWGRPLAWSPDGSAIAFGVLEPFGIGVAPAAGGAVRRLVSMRTGLMSIDWSHDGRSIVLEDVEGRVSILDLRRHSLRTLTRNVRSPRWSPNDESLLVTGPEGHALYTVAVDTGKKTLFRSLGKRSSSSAAWAPDGRQIAYATYSGGLFVFDLSTRNERRYKLPPGGFATDLDWRP